MLIKDSDELLLSEPIVRNNGNYHHYSPYIIFWCGSFVKEKSERKPLYGLIKSVFMHRILTLFCSACLTVVGYILPVTAGMYQILPSNSGRNSALKN